MTTAPTRPVDVARIVYVDSKLAGAVTTMHDNPADRRRSFLGLIDDLLDERLIAMGVPVRPRPKTSSRPGVTVVCQSCGTPSPAAPGGFVDCPICDRIACACGKRVLGRRDLKCPDGHWLDRGANAAR